MPPPNGPPPDASDVQEAPRTLGATLKRLGPGMIVAGSIVGSGELIATTKVGAEAGFWLLWLVVVGCVIKVFTQVEFGRHTMTWGETPLEALDGVPGPRYRVNWLVWYWVLMTALVLSQQGGIVGGVGQALAIAQPLTAQGETYNRMQDELVAAKVERALAASQTPTGAELAGIDQRIAVLTDRAASMPAPNDPYVWAVLIAVVTAVLLYIGRYRMIQVFATVLVGLFTLLTLVTGVMMQTTAWAVTPQELGLGLSLRLPPAVEGITPVATALAAFGIIGLGSAELIMYPYWCLEKGYARWTGPRDGSAGWLERARGWIRVLYTDAWLSMVVYTFATVAFYLLGAAVLWRIGLNPAGGDMVRTLAEMYVPVFGPWGYHVFLFGAFAVLYSTFFVAAAGFGRMIADSFRLFGFIADDEATRMWWSRLISALWPLAALVIYLFVRAPVAMVLASGVAQGIMLPMLGFAALYFRYRRSDPGLRPGRLWDAMLWLSGIGFLIVGIWTVYTKFAG